tara:strand:+ start:814 stop:1338 length:525 start_codon:yes stop_codon:yes gene_type:complete
MAHFAKLGVNGKVIAVHVLNNSDMLNADNQEDETVGQQRLQEIHGWPAQMWIQTSYNTRGGKHYDANGDLSSDQSKAFRGNYAGIGHEWDETNQLFFGPQPHASWSKNTTTASWDSPITYPSQETYLDDSSTTQSWIITWNETAYQANNSKGWEGQKVFDGAKFDWNGSAWIAQ